MARTKASVGAKVSSGKSSKARCSAAPPPSSSVPSGSSDRTTRSYGGGNPVCQRETPKWQRPITNFFLNKQPSQESEDVDVHDEDNCSSAATSKQKQKRNIIYSDDEEEETPKNTVLDETIELEPLNGEDSHKIEEYYPNNGVKNTLGTENDVEDKDNAVKDRVQIENGVEGNENGVKDNEIRKKGKGKGKKTNKENLDSNIDIRKPLKRDLEEIAVGEENEHVSKKIKV